MAAPYNPPVRAEDLIIGIALEEYGNPGNFLANPTIAAGDFTISKDFGAFVNLTTLPAVTPASSGQVKITVSATEMTADNVGIMVKDQTVPPEWSPTYIHIPTA